MYSEYNLHLHALVLFSSIFNKVLAVCVSVCPNPRNWRQQTKAFHRQRRKCLRPGCSRIRINAGFSRDSVDTGHLSCGQLVRLSSKFQRSGHWTHPCPALRFPHAAVAAYRCLGGHGFTRSSQWKNQQSWRKGMQTIAKAGMSRRLRAKTTPLMMVINYYISN